MAYTIEQLIAQSEAIRDEKVKKANTAERVGGTLKNFAETFGSKMTEIVVLTDEEYQLLVTENNVDPNKIYMIAE